MVCAWVQVHAVRVGGREYAVKVMPLDDIATARPYHFRDIVTTFLRARGSPFIERPLYTFLRLKDDGAAGSAYFLYTLWPRRCACVRACVMCWRLGVTQCDVVRPAGVPGSTLTRHGHNSTLVVECVLSMMCSSGCAHNARKEEVP